MASRKLPSKNQAADGGQTTTEHQITESRSVIDHGGSLYINITDHARKAHNISAGDELKIVTCQGKLEIRTKNENNLE